VYVCVMFIYVMCVYDVCMWCVWCVCMYVCVCVCVLVFCMFGAFIIAQLVPSPQNIDGVYFKPIVSTQHHSPVLHKSTTAKTTNANTSSPVTIHKHKHKHKQTTPKEMKAMNTTSPNNHSPSPTDQQQQQQQHTQNAMLLHARNQWHRAPYVNVFVLKCEDYDTYRVTHKPIIKQFIESITHTNNKHGTPKKSSKSSPARTKSKKHLKFGANNVNTANSAHTHTRTHSLKSPTHTSLLSLSYVQHTSKEWLVLYVTLGTRSPVLGASASAKDASKIYRKVYDRLRSDFAKERCVRIDMFTRNSSQEDGVCACVCVCDNGRACVRVCESERERDRERERERERYGYVFCLWFFMRLH